jgi:hypothetical protein
MQKLGRSELSPDFRGPNDWVWDGSRSGLHWVWVVRRRLKQVQLVLLEACLGSHTQ